MKKIAGAIVMCLGRFTIAVLHLFEKLGVDMSAFDEALARLTTFTQAQANELKNAKSTINDQHAEIDKLISDDAAQDQIDIATAVKAALDAAAAQIDGVTNSLENPPADTTPVDPTPPSTDPSTAPVTDPGPPQTPPSGDFPTTDVPVVTPDPGATVPPESVPDPVTAPPADPAPPVVDFPADPAPADPAPVDTPVVTDPGADPVPAGDLPSDTPVVEAPAGPVTEVPTDAPVVDAGTLPADAPVVEVTPPATDTTGQ